MDANLGDGMSSVIPTYYIVRAENARANPLVTRAPPFASAHHLFDLQNAPRPALEPRSGLRLSRVIIDFSHEAESIIERFGNGANEQLAHVAATGPDG
jgi:hypothetical protein